MKCYRFKIEGLDCPNCANSLEEALQKVDCISNVSVNFIMQKLSFECEEENISKAMEKVKKVVKKEEPDVILEEE